MHIDLFCISVTSVKQMQKDQRTDEGSDAPDALRRNRRWYRGMPSPNPRGRPRVGTTLANAIRERVPPTEIVAHAVRLLESAATPPAVKLRTLAFLDRRGYGRPATASSERAA